MTKNYKVEKDLSIYNEDIMESLFIEIINEKNKNIIVRRCNLPGT